MPTKRPTPAARTRRTAPAAGSLPQVAIVVSRYNATVTDPLLQGAIGAYVRAGGSEENLRVLSAAGAFEVPVLCEAAAQAGFPGVVALGCIIRGETRHDRVLGDAVTHALMELSVRRCVAVGLGVLTVENAEQAIARAGGDKGNKGAEAMEAVLMTLAEFAGVRSGRSRTSSKAKHPPRPDKLASRKDRA